MKWDASWYGGPNYRAGGPDEREPVRSIEAAKDLLWFRYLNRDNSTPCVDETSDIYLYAPTPEGETWTDYPDYRVFFGPRMGIRVEKL